MCGYTEPSTLTVDNGVTSTNPYLRVIDVCIQVSVLHRFCFPVCNCSVLANAYEKVMNHGGLLDCVDKCSVVVQVMTAWPLFNWRCPWMMFL